MSTSKYAWTLKFLCFDYKLVLYQKNQEQLQQQQHQLQKQHQQQQQKQENTNRTTMKQLKGKQIIYQAEVEGGSGMNGEGEGDVHVSSCIVASCTGEKSTLHIGEMNKGIEKASWNMAQKLYLKKKFKKKLLF